MKKQIFVTVEEFEDNGGKLETGRDLFEPNLFSKEIEPAGKYLDTALDGYILYTKPNGKNDEDGHEYLYVQIDCQPIYK